MDDITTKHCHKCNRDLPASAEYWSPITRRGKSTFASQCRDCARERAKQWAQDNPERNRQRAKQWADENPDRIRQRNAEHYAQHVDDQREYRAEHADHYRELKQTPEYRAKEAERRKRNADEIREYNREYRAAHPEVYSNAVKEYRARNPEKVKALMQQRMAARVGAPGNYTADDVTRMYTEQEGMCAYCGIRVFMDIPYDVQVDHVVSLSRGGSNTADNLLLSCRRCNQSKNNRTVSEWEATRGW